jgi:hypothetical protein
MAPVAAVGDADGVVGVDVGGVVGVGTGVDVVPLVLLPPQATSKTARIRLHIASADQRVRYRNRVNILRYFLLILNFSNP